MLAVAVQMKVTGFEFIISGCISLSAVRTRCKQVLGVFY